MKEVNLMEKFDVVIYFPNNSVRVKTPRDRAEVQVMMDSLVQGRFIRVIGTSGEDVLINPALVTHVEATPTNLPF